MHLRVFLDDVEHQPKQRPRFSMKTRRVYTPKETVRHEKWIREKVKEQLEANGVDMTALPFAGPVRLVLVFGIPPPKSHPKWAKEATDVGLWYPERRVDVDNLAKLVKDALNKVLWADDWQVMSLMAIKHQSHFKGTLQIDVETCDHVDTFEEWKERKRSVLK